MLVEVCVQNLEDAIRAEEAGADRIELCASLETGGLTPSAGLIIEVIKRLSIPAHVLIRSRGGDFCYSASEIDVLVDDIKMAMDLGAQGIVTGVLQENNRLDQERMEHIRMVCEDRHLTFHRAFDLVSDPLQALNELDTIGVDTILTSGQRKSAIDGLSLLQELRSKSKNVMIMPGGGVRVDNILQFQETGFQAIHFSATTSESMVQDESQRFSVSDLGASARLVLQPELLQKMIRSVK